MAVTSTRTGRRPIARAGVALASLAVALVLVEVGFRLVAPRLDVSLDRLRAVQRHLLEGNGEFEPDAHTVYRHRPTPERLALVGRTDDRRGVPHPGGLRVLCMGGSTTESGNSRGQVGSWPHFLGVLLRERLGLPAEVLQGGVAGWTTAESLVAWMLDYGDFAPDLVLVHHGVNDALPARTAGLRSDYGHWRTPLREHAAGALERPLVAASLLWVHLRARRVELDLVAASTRPDGLDRPANADPVDVFERNLVALGSDVVRRGGAFGLVTMPSRPPVADDPDAELRPRIQAYNRRTRRIAAEHGWILVDLERLFEERFPADERAEHFLDAVHVTPLGNVGKAELVAEVLGVEWPALAALLAEGSEPFVEEAR